MKQTRRGCVAFAFLLYIIGVSRDCQVLCFIQNPCTGSGITFQRRDSSMMSYNKDFLIDIYAGLFETERLTNHALEALKKNIINPSHLRHLQRQSPVSTLYAEPLDATSTDRALDNIYDTLDRIMVFISHSERQILRINYTRLREPILRSLTMLKQGESIGGLYYIMCRIMLHLPWVVNINSPRTIGTDLVPYYLHGVSRAQVFDNTYVTLYNVRRVVNDLKQELQQLLERLS